jgi:release factor glutamine methyltransferase
MAMDEIFNGLTKSLINKFSFLEDKPEETLESTLRALWFVASGNPISVQAALEQPLPELSETQLNKLHALIQERQNNKPLAHITGRQRFMDVDFICDKRALIPRKETEILGRKALYLAKQLSENSKKINVIDVCCGAGNLGLSLATNNNKAHIFATDISHEAVELTKENIAFLNLTESVKAEQGDLFSAAETGEFIENTDLVICNPPYISTSKVKTMNPEIIEKEPVLAFDGGMFGTKIIQKLIVEAPKFLKKDGWLIFEVGVGQGEFVMQLCNRSEFYSEVEGDLDEKGIIRVISAKKK